MPPTTGAIAAGEEGDGSLDRGGDAQPWQTRNGGRDDEDMRGIDQAAARPRTLREHLLEQIGADLPDLADRVIAFHLLDQLDEAGYLRGGLDGAAGAARLPVRAGRARARPPAGVRPARGVCPRPAGVPRLAAARPQSARSGDAAAARQPAAARGAQRAGAVADLRGRRRGPRRDGGRDQVARPAPGARLRPAAGTAGDPGHHHAGAAQGGWLVELNAETLPRVLVNNRYYARISHAARSKAEREYLTDRLQAANWLVKSLHQRATTILKVATEIVGQQDGFFRRGVQALRPLILRDIADAIGMHESTVSRVTTNKYMATPRGLFELKYFFTSSIAASHGGDAHSAEAVRFRIRGLIDGEPSNETLSDERIVELLQAQGVDIARRTVAKYREAMRIPSSVQRRREKMLAL